jgi:lipopolysaccharide export system protein LptC
MSRATHKRTAHRWQVGAMIGAGVVFALGSFWLVQVINGGDIGAASGVPKGEPDVIEPVVLNIGSEKPPMTMRARTAHVDQAKDSVELAGAVDIRRPQQGAIQGMSLKTEALTVHPDEDRMETDQPFQMVAGATTLAGVGMNANNATGRLDVKNRVQLNYPPRAR